MPALVSRSSSPRALLVALGLGALSLGAAGLSACSTAPRAPDAPTSGYSASGSPAANALLRADRAFAADSIAKGTQVAFSDYSAEAVVNLPANGPITYAKDSLLLRLNDMGDSVLTWAPQRAEVSDSGELGFTWGEWALRQGGVSGNVLARGKYLNVWRLQPDGTWKVVVDMANTAKQP